MLPFQMSSDSSTDKKEPLENMAMDKISETNNQTMAA